MKIQNDYKYNKVHFCAKNSYNLIPKAEIERLLDLSYTIDMIAEHFNVPVRIVNKSLNAEQIVKTPSLKIPQESIKLATLPDNTRDIFAKEKEFVNEYTNSDKALLRDIMAKLGIPPERISDSIKL